MLLSDTVSKLERSHIICHVVEFTSWIVLGLSTVGEQAVQAYHSSSTLVSTNRSASPQHGPANIIDVNSMYKKYIYWTWTKVMLKFSVDYYSTSRNLNQTILWNMFGSLKIASKQQILRRFEMKHGPGRWKASLRNGHVPLPWLEKHTNTGLEYLSKFIMPYQAWIRSWVILGKLYVDLSNFWGTSFGGWGEHPMKYSTIRRIPVIQNTSFSEIREPRPMERGEKPIFSEIDQQNQNP